jgi:hypothetical protein
VARARDMLVIEVELSRLGVSSLFSLDAFSLFSYDIEVRRRSARGAERVNRLLRTVIGSQPTSISLDAVKVILGGGTFGTLMEPLDPAAFDDLNVAPL